MINTWSWIIWLGSVLIVLWSTRNPVYLGLIFFILIIVWSLVKKGIEKDNLEASPQIPFSPLKISLFIILFSAIFNGLISQFGRSLLITLPSWIPYLGGPFTLEAMVFGAINGLVLSGILTAFFIINLALPVHSLLRLIPRAFYPVAVVASIAITFMPNTIRQLEQIREAQAIRGHRIRGFRDWIPLIMPLLVGGLEKALGLAEAMTARGFASRESAGNSKSLRISQALGLALIFSGWLLQLFSFMETMGIFILFLGMGLVIFSLWKIGRSSPRSFYRQVKWSGYDFIVIALSLLSIVVFWLPSLRINRSSLFYNPYPFLSAPMINPFIIIVALGLLSPGITFSILGNLDIPAD
jgi:energy-coupling factor transport system permease protein